MPGKREIYTSLFTEKAAYYDEFRPRYATAAIDDLVSEGVLAPGSRVADVGCGTGIFTRQVACALGAGSQVVGVEPNDGMRACAEDLAASLPAGAATVRFAKGSAEDTGLVAGSVDAVTAAQAFHWFDPNAFRAECLRVLGDEGGWGVLVWNVKQPCDMERAREEIVAQYRAVYDTYGCSWDDRRAGIEAFFGGACEHRAYDNPLVETWDAFITRTLSASHAVDLDDPRIDEYVARWQGFFDRFADGDAITTPNATEVFFGRLDAR